MKRISILILLFLIFLTVAFGFLREILLPIFGTTELALILTPSIFVSIAAIYIRFVIIDVDKISNTLDPDKNLKVNLFYNFMPMAALCSTAADFAIILSLIAGIIFFLVAQILHIIAFFGIISLSPKSKNVNRTLLKSLLIGWGGLATFLYLFLIYNPEDSLTLFVIPYIIVLTVCAFMTSYGLSYKSRPLSFRLMLFLGSLSFLISDTVLGYTIFRSTFHMANYILGITYILALILLQYAVIYLENEKKNI